MPLLGASDTVTGWPAMVSPAMVVLPVAEPHRLVDVALIAVIFTTGTRGISVKEDMVEPESVLHLVPA
jgi:hypothetical protein